MKRCQHCDRRPYISTATRVTSNGDVCRYYMCRNCKQTKLRAYRRTETGKAAVKRAVQKYVAGNRERVRAWNAVRNVPLEPCEVCGVTGNVDRHHDVPADKRKVKFLCRFHHKQRHRELDALVPGQQLALEVA